MAHNEPNVFKTLVSLIDNELHDIYIHIDAKANKQIFKNITDKFVIKSKVNFIPSISVSWGGVSLVKAELNLLQAALKDNEEYSFYHYLSGVDLPLTTNEERYAFFERNTGKEFIDIQSVPMEKKWLKRVKYYWLFEKNSRKTPYKLVRYIFVLLQILVGVNRLKETKYKVQYGSNWVSITNKYANDLLSFRKEIETFFNKTHCSDEFLFQTFINNKENYNLYRDSKGGFSNVRYINWEKGNDSGSPSIINQDDVCIAISSGAMFARKFNGKDLKTLNFIESMIGRSKYNDERI